MNISEIMAALEAKHPGEKEYLQAVKEVLLSVEDVYNQHPEFEKARIIERMVEPDRIFTFRVTWIDDKGEVQNNIGYRVQFNNAIGPYKGGIRFHASVNLSILKFLGFEQTFKNALTTLPMGGGKGGSDFSPRGKSDAEIMRFCQAFILELWRNLGPDRDVPAGDIGVGGREVGYMYGMYKKLARENTGTFTGKGLSFGGSRIRPEATGFGAIYFVQDVLKKNWNETLAGKTVAISGFGNVAWGAATKATELGAKVITISGPDGYILDPAGLDKEKIEYMLELRASGNDVVAPYADRFPGSTFFAGKKPWEQKVDIALPCATQNELNGEDAKQLIANGVQLCAEVSNMGCTPEAIDAFIENHTVYCPGKAVRDLRVYAQTINGNVLHYRDSRGLECDTIVHLKDGRWAPIEIKLGGDNLIEEGARNLMRLKSDIAEKNQPSFMMILTATGPAYRRQDGIYVVPINCLKA